MVVAQVAEPPKTVKQNSVALWTDQKGVLSSLAELKRQKGQSDQHKQACLAYLSTLESNIRGYPAPLRKVAYYCLKQIPLKFFLFVGALRKFWSLKLRLSIKNKRRTAYKGLRRYSRRRSYRRRSFRRTRYPRRRTYRRRTYRRRYSLRYRR